MAQASAPKTQNIAVITGVSGGLGRAIAECLIKNKWIVIGCARSADKIAALNQKYPSKDVTNAPYFSVVDVSDVNGIKKWSDMVLKNYGTPTLVLANAGIAQKVLLIENIDPKQFDLIQKVNVGGVFALARAFLPALKKANKNSIIMGMSSSGGINGFPGFAGYCSSKFGLEGLIQVISGELKGTNIAAISYDPGMIGTNMYSGVNNIKDINTVDVPTTQDFVDEFYPQLLKILKNPQEYHPKLALNDPGTDVTRVVTPVMTNPKYADKLKKAGELFGDTIMKGLMKQAQGESK